MTCRHGFEIEKQARRQAQRKTRNSDERPGDGLMTAFLEFANPADIVRARDSAAVLALACRKSRRRRIWHFPRGFFSISFDRSSSPKPRSKTVARAPFLRSEAARLLADLQSNGDIQITGPEESVLKRRSTVHDRRCIPALRRRKGHKTMFASIVRRYQAWRLYETVRRELSHLTDRLTLV
jgi:hypothetical protein